jgi:hypothetical protein
MINLSIGNRIVKIDTVLKSVSKKHGTTSEAYYTHKSNEVYVGLRKNGSLDATSLSSAHFVRTVLGKKGKAVPLHAMEALGGRGV